MPQPRLAVKSRVEKTKVLPAGATAIGQLIDVWKLDQGPSQHLEG